MRERRKKSLDGMHTSFLYSAQVSCLELEYLNLGGTLSDWGVGSRGSFVWCFFWWGKGYRNGGGGKIVFAFIKVFRI